MKSSPLLRTLVLISAASLAPGLARGGALTATLTESFNYTTTANATDDTGDGNIGTNTGGTGWGATPSAWSNNVAAVNTSTVLNVVNPGLLYAGLPVSGNALNINATSAAAALAFYRPLNQGAALDAGTFYFSFLMRKDADSQRTINLSFFGNGNNTERFTIGQFSPAATTTNGTIGVTQLNTGPAVLSATPINFDLGLTFLVVGRVDFNVSGTTDRLTVYINPALNGSGEPATPYIQVQTVDFGSIDQVRPFVGNAASPFPGSNATFDEIRLGPSYSAVTAVPEPASILLLAISAAGLLGRRGRRS